MLRSSSSWQDAFGLEQRVGASRGVEGGGNERPSSLAWMLSEILHGCPALAPAVMILLSARSHRPSFGFSPGSDFNRLFEFLGILYPCPLEGQWPRLSHLIYAAPLIRWLALENTSSPEPGIFRANAEFLLLWRIRGR